MCRFEEVAVANHCAPIKLKVFGLFFFSLSARLRVSKCVARSLKKGNLGLEKSLNRPRVLSSEVCLNPVSAIPVQTK